MSVCVVCTNSSYNCKGKGISFHRFPKNEDRLYAWLVAVKSHLRPPRTVDSVQEEISKPHGAYICSEHFSPTCCFDNPKAKYLGYKCPPKVLSEDAIPTIFGGEKSRGSSDSQRGKRARKQLLDDLLTEEQAGYVPGSHPPSASSATSDSQCGKRARKQLPDDLLTEEQAGYVPGSHLPSAGSATGTIPPRPISGLHSMEQSSTTGTIPPGPSTELQSPAPSCLTDTTPPGPVTDIQFTVPSSATGTIPPGRVTDIQSPGPPYGEDTEHHCHCTSASQATVSMFHSYSKIKPPPTFCHASTQTDPLLVSSPIKPISSTPLKNLQKADTEKTSTPIKIVEQPDAGNSSFQTVSSVTTVYVGGEKDTSYKLPLSDSDSNSGESGDSDVRGNLVGQDVPEQDWEQGTYYLVHRKHLFELFRCCQHEGCGKPLLVGKTFPTGCALTVEYECGSHSGKWYSQPHISNSTAFEGNVIGPAAVLFAGGTYQKTADIAATMNLQWFSSSHYQNVQRTYLIPAIDEYYTDKQEYVLDLFRNADDVEADDVVDVTLLGDGRCDSPGHNAKYGSYTFMEESSKYILDFQLIQVSESNSSQAMEKDGFVRGLDFLMEQGISVECIATDRHPSIRAVLKKTPAYRHISHQFDVFHMDKSIKKKLSALAQKRRNKALEPWLKAISTHLWWSSSTCGGDDVLLQEKWRSVTHHIGNIHEFPVNNLFKQCGHEPLSEEDLADIKWLKPGTPPHQALAEVVEDKNILKDLAQLTGFKHTGALEVFHSMLLKYAPKRQHFPYLSMKARLQLAVLDHNNNVFRDQAHTKTGDARWSAAFSKRANSWIARKKFSQKDYGFRTELLRNVIRRASSGQYTYGQKVLPDPDVGGPNIAPVELASKEELVLNFLSRWGDA